MAVDIDDTISAALDAVERAMRNQLADTLVEVLGNVADGVEADCDESAAEEYADGEVDVDDEETRWDAAEVHALLRQAFMAGRDAMLDTLRDQIESAQFTGWRPAVTPAEAAA